MRFSRTWVADLILLLYFLFQHCQELIEMTGQVAEVKSDSLARLLQRREGILLEVARMIRLARLLKSRLKEPLCPEQ